MNLTGPREKRNGSQKEEHQHLKEEQRNADFSEEMVKRNENEGENESREP